jgi:hypothetical protein
MVLYISEESQMAVVLKDFQCARCFITNDKCYSNGTDNFILEYNIWHKAECKVKVYLSLPVQSKMSLYHTRRNYYSTQLNNVILTERIFLFNSFILSQQLWNALLYCCYLIQLLLVKWYYIVLEWYLVPLCHCNCQSIFLWYLK